MKASKRITSFVLAFLLILSSGCRDVLAMSPGIGEASVTAAEPSVTQEEPRAFPDQEKSLALVNYVVVEEPMVTTPGTQNIMMGIGDGSGEITAASLTYRNSQTKQSYVAEAKEILDDFVLFSMEYTSQSQAGIYHLESISYMADGTAYEAAFAQMGIDASYGVNQVAESEPDDVFLSDEEVEALAEDTQMSIVSLDEEGSPVSGETLEQAMESAGCDTMDALPAAVGLRKGGSVDSTGMSSLVVVLDAGHGGSDPGAMANGIVEKTVNLKIAQYCKAELEEYAGVKVYMTREGDTYLSLAQRAQVAIDKKADVFVSLHNNSNVSAAPCGANVYYPNSSYNASCGATGQALATIIESKLTDLGLASGGIHIRNSENNTRYPDGSLADYYGVIKRCKENGIPALIVEHAFISNASDAANFLSSDDKLKKLGIADATGIAEYYGLTKGLGFTSVQSNSSTTMDLEWKRVDGVTGYRIDRSIASGSGFQRVANIKSAATTKWKDTGLEPGTTYYYRIRTYTQSGSKIKYGKFSPVVSGTTMQRPDISSIKSKNSKELVISWATVNNAANYEIYRATKKDGTYSMIAQVTGINRVNYTDAKVTPGQLYYYKIRSVGQVGNTTVYSDYSKVASGRTAKIPTKLYVKSKDTNTLRVCWTGDKNAAGYEIKRADSANGAYKKVGTVKDGSQNYFDDKTVKANRTYYYKVQTYNYNDTIRGVSGFSGVTSGKTIKKTSVTEIAGTSSAKMALRWKKVDGVDGYIIYQSTSQNKGYKKIKTISSASKTSYKTAKLKAGKRYYYKVRTYKKVNGKTGYGSYSSVHSAWIGKKAKITEVQGNSGTKIKVYWNPVSGAQGYDIYRADSLNGTYKKIASAKSASVSYTDKNLNMTKKYYYRIEAKVKGYKATGSSGMSAAVGGSPVQSTSIRSVGANEAGFLEITWNKVKDIKGYRIYRSAQQNGAYTLLTTISDAETTSYTDTSAQKGIVYYYKVALVNEYNNKMIYGADSGVVSGICLAAPMNVRVSVGEDNKLRVTWSSVAGASGYAIYRSTELNGVYTQIDTVASASAVSYTDTSAVTGVTYYYKIRALDSKNNGSEYSAAVSGGILPPAEQP